MAKKPFYERAQPPTAADRAAFRQKFGASPEQVGVGMRRDKSGVYVHTHRARSKSYPTADKIPKRVVKFIESTG